MPPIITFIGWHNSGKTTLATRVVRHLVERGYRIGVVKSSKERDLFPDRQGTDSHGYRQTGAEAVTLVTPDGMMLVKNRPERRLTVLAHRYFPDVDLVVGEGFKEARHVAKIEVTRGDTELLRDRVTGVVAIATDRSITGDHIFRLDESREIADFIEQRFIGSERTRERASLLINGTPVALNPFVQEILASTVTGLVTSLKATGEAGEIELRIRPKQES